MKNILRILFLFIFIFTCEFIYSQNQKYIKKLHSESIQYFNNEDYLHALPLLIELDSLEPNNFETKYYLGVCYLNSGTKDKAIEFLNFAIEKNISSIPADVFKDMGEIYLKKNKFKEALDFFSKYQKIAPHSDQSQSNINILIANTKNAKKLFKDSADVKIEKLDSKINNNALSEYLPIVSADDSHLFYISSIKYKNSPSDSITMIMHSTKDAGIWKQPVAIVFDDIDNHYELAGISSDGQIIYLKLNNNLYSGHINGNKCINIKEIKGVNSEYWEYFISSTPDGNEMYFSSNNLGGYGGKDLYKIVKKEDGSWTSPINLGSKINTALDENYPFIHPDKKTLYFSSNGHNSMGGFDIYKSINLGKNLWSKPKNIGYPINTTSDDLSFSIIANGNSAYVSRVQSDNSYLNDIYKVVFNNNVPLTLVKGTILSGSPLKPIAAKFKVIDKELNLPVKYVYNPNPANGKFLLIFPPGKNYDLIIEADGFLPQLINIYVPNQTYFYELYQEIYLKSIRSLGKVVGEQITVKNTFYDISSLADSLNNTIDTINKNYNVLLQIIEDIINSTDSLQNNEISFLSDNIYKVSEKNNKGVNRDYSHLLDLINKAIATTDTTTLNILEKNTVYVEKTSQSFFYAENKITELVPYVVNSDTIYTVQAINTVKDKEPEHISSFLNTQPELSDSIPEHKTESTIDLNLLSSENKKVILSYTLPFEQNASTYLEKYSFDLVEISQLISNNEGLYLDINAFSESGDQLTVQNSKLNNRINNIISTLLSNDMSFDKIRTSETINTNKVNKIDLIVYEIIDIDQKSKAVSINLNNEKLNLLNEIVFRVQLKALIKKEDADSKLFNGIKVERIYHNGLYKYISGEFSDIKSVKDYLIEIKKRGFEDAFIVLFKNGVRVEQQEAIKLLKEFEKN